MKKNNSFKEFTVKNGIAGTLLTFFIFFSVVKPQISTTIL